MAEKWRLEGTVFDACNCETLCPCVYFQPPNNKDCWVTGVWHVEKDNYGKTALNNFNIAFVGYATQNPLMGIEKAGFVLDERLSQEQRDALLQILGGKAGGLFSQLSVKQLLGIWWARFDHTNDGRTWSVKAGDALEIKASFVKPPPGVPMEAKPKTTQSFRIFLNPEGKICGDDWAYVEFPEGLESRDGGALMARQPERALYMRSESQKEQGWLREVFDRSMSENVATRKEDCEFPAGTDGCSLTKKKCVFNEGMRWCYYSFSNSRVLVKREDLLGPEKVVNEVPVNLVVLLRRDDHSPAEVKLTPGAAIDVLQKGEYMVLPGAGPKEKWGTISTEPWYNPYLLELDNSKQARFFRAMFENWKVPCVILNTGVENIQQTHNRIVAALEASAG